MDAQVNPSLSRSLIRAFAAFALSGFYGAVAGVWVGGSIGIFFLFVGVLPGMLIAAGVPHPEFCLSGILLTACELIVRTAAG